MTSPTVSDFPIPAHSSSRAFSQAEKADKETIDAAIAKLKQLKIDLDAEVKKAMAAGDEEAKAKENFRSKMGNALESRLFYIPSFKIYGGVAGLYDYGPPGCAVKANLQSFWRQHFVLNEGMLEVECPSVTPETVLRASGHVEKFTDLMVKDLKTGDCFRADHLVEDNLERILQDPMLTAERRRELVDMQARLEEFTPEEMGAAIVDLGIKSPRPRTIFPSPTPSTSCSPLRLDPAATRRASSGPETAQGIFVNFRDLLYYNGGKLPFAAAQVGQSFRNEIAPAPVSSAYASSPRRRLSTSSTPSVRSTPGSGRWRTWSSASSAATRSSAP